jgi:hypothetical protein
MASWWFSETPKPLVRMATMIVEPRRRGDAEKNRISLRLRVSAVHFSSHKGEGGSYAPRRWTPLHADVIFLLMEAWT